MNIQHGFISPHYRPDKSGACSIGVRYTLAIPPEEKAQAAAKMAKPRKKPVPAKSSQTAAKTPVAQPKKAKRKKTKKVNGVFPMTDAQRRRIINAGLEPSTKARKTKASRHYEEQQEELEKAKKQRREQKRRQRMKDMPAVRKVVLGGAPGLGKNRKH